MSVAQYRMTCHGMIEHSDGGTLLSTEHSADFLREKNTDLQRSGDRLFLSPQKRTQQRRCTHVLLGRQFGSYSQLNQVIGRAARPDSDCNVIELINPLSGTNLDTTVIVGTPKEHRLVFKRQHKWVIETFDYTTKTKLCM